jgi:hypothetical protein
MMVGDLFDFEAVCKGTSGRVKRFQYQSGQASPNRQSLEPSNKGVSMAQTHYTSKRKRRPKNTNRKDTAAATMATLRELAAATKSKGTTLSR